MNRPSSTTLLSHGFLPLPELLQVLFLFTTSRKTIIVYIPQRPASLPYSRPDGRDSVQHPARGSLLAQKRNLVFYLMQHHPPTPCLLLYISYIFPSPPSCGCVPPCTRRQQVAKGHASFCNAATTCQRLIKQKKERIEDLHKTPPIQLEKPNSNLRISAVMMQFQKPCCLSPPFLPSPRSDVSFPWGGQPIPQLNPSVPDPAVTIHGTPCQPYLRDTPDRSVNMRAAMFMDCSSWNSSFAAYGM